MTNVTNLWGLQRITNPPHDGNGSPRVVLQSSAVGDYPDALGKPGSSFLWVGADQHLNREQVAELVAALNHWLQTGRLFEPEAP